MCSQSHKQAAATGSVLLAVLSFLIITTAAMSQEHGEMQQARTCLVGSTNKTKERRKMMIFVQPRILPDFASHFLAQTKFGGHSANLDEAAQFAGMPETIVPRAIP